MTSVKLRTSWTDENVIIEGVRIYKSNEEFDVETKPLPLVGLTNGEEFYEDFDVELNETVYYMLSCFLGEQEVFTECFEVNVSKQATALEYVVNSLVKNSPTSTSTSNQISAIEPAASNSSNIVIAIVSTQTTMATPEGWNLLSNKLSTYIFWRRGGNPGVARTFRLSSPSQIGLYMFVLQPNGDFSEVECVSLLSSKNTTSIDPTAPSPILNSPIEKRGFEIMLGKPQYAQNANSDGSVSSGYTLIATNMYPTKVGHPYHMDLILGGRVREKGEQVGGGVITQINAYQPSILFMQTIQICAS